MGNWRVEVEGVGFHHNKFEKDVEAITARFIADLKAASHTIQRVRVVAGGWQECEHAGLSLVPETK